jgi:transcriptional regulator with XRE-family HTH domain
VTAHDGRVDAIRFGRSIRALRRRQRLRQTDVAERAQMSDTLVSRIEQGRLGVVPFATLHALARALDAELELNLRWRGEGLDRLLDEAHAEAVDLVVSLLRSLGWETVIEASFAIAGERGSIDILAWHAASRTIAVIEVKSVIPDVQAMISTLDRKARLAPSVAKQRGWNCGAVGRFLFVAEARTARRRVARHAAIFDVAFPVRGREASAWLEHPNGQPVSALVFINRSSQRASHSRGAGMRRAVARPPKPIVMSPRSVRGGAPAGGVPDSRGTGI